MSIQTTLSLEKTPPDDVCVATAPQLDTKEDVRLMDDPGADCWMCHESHSPWELIRACACSGPVHRTCLDRWRAVSPNPSSFSQCDVCQAQFEFEDDPLLLDGPRHACCSPKCKFGVGVTRDVVLLLALCAGLGFLIGMVVIPAIDPSRLRDRFMPSSWSHVAVDAVWGIVGFFAVLGVTGLMVLLVRCLGEIMFVFGSRPVLTLF